MKISDIKYLAAYIIPMMYFTALLQGGWYTYMIVLFAFVLVPFLEWALPQSTSKFAPQEAEERLSNSVFDVLLYVNLPMVWTAIAIFGIYVSNGLYATWELVGLTISLGILMGANGINVAHELGHRSSKVERIMSKLLLLPSFYLHFIIEHNRGHHRNVGTLSDPATARYGESVYAFLWRSIINSYWHAWQLERERLKEEGHAFWSFHNEMIRFTIFEVLYLAGLILLFNTTAVICLILAAVLSFVLLECINYVEHYGLMRQKYESGMHERVRSHHSWNSNHHMGRIILYELTRHSDHHYKSSKKYQVLEHHDRSPQLPFGYPTSILISLVPPLWFSIMNPRAKEYTGFEHTSL
ncbi:MAG: alkane 1-monooxygenase [Saprospiraceae bacterium]|nr:alkane 1-monooxygenase [Saprospiraceae bacterium]